MKLFADTANLTDIESALKKGFIQGITTNPSLLAKEPKGNFELHIGQIVELIKTHKNGIHLSVEVFSRNLDEIIRQANHFRDILNYEQLSIKVQIGLEELEVIRKLKEDGFSVNCTCCMSVNQAIMAASSGARYVSLFWGRIRDILNDTSMYGFHGFKQAKDEGILDALDADPAKVVGMTRALLDKSYPNVEIIAGSIRKATDIRDAGLAGAHIVTVPPKFFPQMATHFKTEEVVEQFLTDFKKWLS
ncbi:MAG: hypothetical protein HYV51_00180 [Parcubacteria group bacterium]|nr:hypothetical protein [Parcubacteria group bacterium]